MLKDITLGQFFPGKSLGEAPQHCSLQVQVRHAKVHAGAFFFQRRHGRVQ